MSKTYPGGVSVLTPFEVQADGPIADYMVVDSTSDLTNLREFAGMLVYVVAEASFYYYNETIWVKLEVGASGGSSGDDYFGIAGYDGTITYDVDENINTITVTLKSMTCACMTEQVSGSCRNFLSRR